MFGIYFERDILLTNLLLARSTFNEKLPKSWPKVDPDPKERRRHKSICTGILCGMVRSRGPQLSWGLFSLPFLCFCLRAQKMTSISKNLVITKAFAPKFCAELSDREVHSFHGDYFRDNFCIYVSGQLSANNIRATFDGSTFSEIYV